MFSKLENAVGGTEHYRPLDSSGRNLLLVDTPKVNKLSKNFPSISKDIKLILLILSDN